MIESILLLVSILLVFIIPFTKINFNDSFFVNNKICLGIFSALMIFFILVYKSENAGSFIYVNF